MCPINRYHEKIIEEHAFRIKELEAEIEKAAQRIVDKEKRIGELQSLVEKMKCCTNCRHDMEDDYDPDAGCEGCLDGYTKWDLKE